MIQKRAVIIVAGGKGLRMQTNIPKQFIEVFKLPVLMHTITRFSNFDASMEIVLVLPKDHFEYWNSLCKQYNFLIPHKIVNGGEQRFCSVLNGIKAIENAEIVGVHDGVRPLVSSATIERCFDCAVRFGTAIPVADAVESIRHIYNGKSEAVDRTKYKMVQTPQVFQFSLLKNAYGQDFSELFTDDASVVEAYVRSEMKNSDVEIRLVEGNRENIKITTQFDLLIAEAVFANGF